jgi:alpha-amylase
MPSVCLYFQIHQPFRLRRYTAFDTDHQYFDAGMNAHLVRRIAENCYVPMNRLLLELVTQHEGRFRVAFSVTGTAVEQLEAYAPEVVEGWQALAQTRCVEFLGETYYHSLSSLHAEGEFREQVELHRQMIRRLFGQTPTVFRNTELIYSNRVAALAAELGFRGVLAEGWEPVLNNRSAAFAYRAAAGRAGGGPQGLAPVLLLRNHRLSDAIAFQFADARSPEFPLTEEKFAQLVAQIGGPLCNLFMDYETFGEHQAAATGIFDFMRALPGRLLAHNCDFRTPGELVAAADASAEARAEGGGGGGGAGTAGGVDVPSPMSWADEARDLGAWMGNAMQENALQDLYGLETAVKGRADAKLLADWRRLTTSDHAYYMSTKEAADGGVHAYFRPYESPYDAYINFMNILDSVRSRAG